MKLKKLFAGFATMIFLMTFVSAYYGTSDILPSELLENEWFVFAIIFLITFGFVYLSLSKFFTTKEKHPIYDWKIEKKLAKGPVVLISICVAALFSAMVMRSDFFTGYLGESVSMIIFVFILILFLVLMVPFYKFLNKSLGGFGGIGLGIILIILWIFSQQMSLYEFIPYNLGSLWLENFYDKFTSVTGLIVIILISGLLTLFSRMKKD